MTTRYESLKKINKMIANIKNAMLTTVDEDGDLHSRPMMTQEHEFNGEIWFFASRTSDKVREIERMPSVNVVYADGSNYVSIAGRAHIVTDVAKKKELWNDALRIWFEEGAESPDVVLIHVNAKSAQYWDTPDGAIGKAVSMVKVILTGDEDASGDSAKVQF